MVEKCKVTVRRSFIVEEKREIQREEGMCSEKGVKILRVGEDLVKQTRPEFHSSHRKKEEERRKSVFETFYLYIFILCYFYFFLSFFVFYVRM